MSCLCDRFDPLVLRRVDVEARVAATPAIRATFVVTAESRNGDARLYRCATCDQLWQSGRHASVGRREYVFQVPEIAREAWLSEPYCDPVELLAYSEEKRWLAQTRDLGTRPTPPSGRLFFLSPDTLVEDRARASQRGGSVGVDGASSSASPDAQHLEPLRSASATRGAHP
jgi:hypothetical protein